MSKRRILLLAKIVVSIALIALILVKADLTGFLEGLKDANPFMFGLALLVTALTLLSRSYKWQLLLRVQGARISLLTTQNLSYMSLFFNNFFLGALGGDTFRVYRTSSYCDSLGGAASSVVMERATGALMAILLVLGLGIAYLFTSQALVTASQVGVLLMVGLAIALAAFALLKAQSKFFNQVVARKYPRLAGLVEDLMSSLRTYQNHKSTMALALTLSLLYHIGNGLTVYVIAFAVNADVAFIPVLFISSLVALVTMIPISINGLGVQEGSFIFYLQQLGATGSAALLVALLYRLTLLILGLIGGLIFLLDSGSERKSRIITERQGFVS